MVVSREAAAEVAAPGAAASVSISFEFCYIVASIETKINQYEHEIGTDAAATGAAASAAAPGFTIDFANVNIIDESIPP